MKSFFLSLLVFLVSFIIFIKIFAMLLTADFIYDTANLLGHYGDENVLNFLADATSVIAFAGAAIVTFFYRQTNKK